MMNRNGGSSLVLGFGWKLRVMNTVRIASRSTKNIILDISSNGLRDRKGTQCRPGAQRKKPLGGIQ